MATSKLQRLVGDMLDKELPQFRIRENYRPDWLVSSERTKLELDFYIEELGIAFEIQGAQHYDFIPFFHVDMNGFEKRKMFDREKKELCRGYGVRLIEILTETDAIVAVKEIKDRVAPPSIEGKYFYQDGCNNDNKKQYRSKRWNKPKERVSVIKSKLDFGDKNKDKEASQYLRFLRHGKIYSREFTFLHLTKDEQNEILRLAKLL